MARLMIVLGAEPGRHFLCGSELDLLGLDDDDSQLAADVHC
jgi:hypothetical protein